MENILFQWFNLKFHYYVKFYNTIQCINLFALKLYHHISVVYNKLANHRRFCYHMENILFQWFVLKFHYYDKFYNTIQCINLFALKLYHHISVVYNKLADHRRFCYHMENILFQWFVLKFHYYGKFYNTIQCINLFALKLYYHISVVYNKLADHRRFCYHMENILFQWFVLKFHYYGKFYNTIQCINLFALKLYYHISVVYNKLADHRQFCYHMENILFQWFVLKFHYYVKFYNTIQCINLFALKLYHYNNFTLKKRSYHNKFSYHIRVIHFKLALL